MTPFFKPIAIILLALTLIVWHEKSRAVTPQDLEQGKVLTSGYCAVAGLPMPCLLIEQEGKKYVLLLDRKYEPLGIFEVEGDPPYDISNQTPVWVRGKET